MWEKFLYLAQKYPLSLIQHILLLLPIFISVYRYKFLGQELKIISFFFLLSFIKESIFLYCVIKHINTLGMENIFSCLQAIIVYIMYASAIHNTSINKRLLIALLLVLIVSIFTFKQYDISNIGNTIIRTYLIFSALYFFIYLLEELKVDNLFLYGFFWVNTGILIYAAGTLFTYLFSEYVFSPNTSDEAFELYWDITQVTSILFTLLASLGIFVSKFEKSSVA